MKFSTVVATAAAQWNPNEEICYLPLDFVFLQDCTGSFYDDLPNVLNILPSLMETISTNHPNTQYGITSFRDKPYTDLGHSSDYCYREEDVMSDNVNAVQKAYSKLLATGGGDYAEAMLQALASVARSETIGWRPISEVRDNSAFPEGHTGARVVIISTDDLPQEPDAYNNYNGVWFPELPLTAVPPPKTMTPWPSTISGVSDDDLCKEFEYPTAEQVKKLLEENQIRVLVVTPPLNDMDTPIQATWKNIVSDVWGFPADFVQLIKDDSSDIVQAIAKALASLTEYECAIESTEAPIVDTTVVATEVATTEEIATTVEITTEVVTVAPTTTVGVTTEAVTVAPTTTVEITTEVVTVAPTTPIVQTEAPTTSVMTTGAPGSPTTAEVQTTTVSETECPTCPPPVTDSEECPPCVDGADCCGPALYIRLNERPKLLEVNYQKGVYPA